MEKNEHGGDRKSMYQNDTLIDTRVKIASQLSIGSATVIRAADFTLAVDKIIAVTCVKINDLLDDKIKGSMDDIKTFAELDKGELKNKENLIIVSIS